MKYKSIHISIPTPCHESWDSMDATERGAFCHSCQKEVIDFSAMTDREVIEYLASHQTGCGRFRKDQLDTMLTIPKIDNGAFRWRALFLSVLSLLSLKNIMAQTDNKTAIAQTSKSKTPQKDSVQRPISDTINLPEAICSSTKPREATVQGVSILEINPQIKSVKTPTKLIAENKSNPPIHKHNIRDWFNRTFRIKHKD